MVPHGGLSLTFLLFDASKHDRYCWLSLFRNLELNSSILHMQLLLVFGTSSLDVVFSLLLKGGKEEFFSFSLKSQCVLC